MTFNYASQTFLHKSANAGFWSYAMPVTSGLTNHFFLAEDGNANTYTPGPDHESGARPGKTGARKPARSSARRRGNGSLPRPAAAAAALN